MMRLGEARLLEDVVVGGFAFVHVEKVEGVPELLDDRLVFGDAVEVVEVAEQVAGEGQAT